MLNSCWNSKWHFVDAQAYLVADSYFFEYSGSHARAYFAITQNCLVDLTVLYSCLFLTVTWIKLT